MALGVLVLGLAALPAMSVRIDVAIDNVPGDTQDMLSQEDVQPHPHAELQDPESSLVETKLLPGIPFSPECCCYEKPCTFKQEQEYQAQPRMLNMSMFDKGPEVVEGCCHNKTLIDFTGCSGGLKLLSPLTCKYTPEKTSSIDKCASRITWWFKRDDWYTMLPDYPTLGWFNKVEKKYQSYVPCLVSKESHTQDTVLHKDGFINVDYWGNPIRLHVMSRPECRDLLKEELQMAVEKSYNQLCPFPLEQNYKPNFNPDKACAFNSTNAEIFFSNSISCPEGHRCACPWSKKELEAYDTNKDGGLANMLRKGRTWVPLLSKVTQVGIVAAVGGLAVGSVVTWPLHLSASLAVGLVYVPSTTWSWYMHACRNTLGCFPMDCVYEEDVGCRINLDLDESDPRNPYWFMPPPMYTCHVNRWGKCGIKACSLDELKHQRVGEATATYGLFRKKPISIVQNCQPMLAKDMTATQVLEFESKVGSLRSKEHELHRRTQVLLERKHKLCPFLAMSDYARAAKCVDGTECDDNVTVGGGKNCCENHKGIMQCPTKYPKLCNDGSCDHVVQNCRARGGVRECPAENECAYLMPHIQNDHVECGNGESLPTSHFADSTWCGGKGGVKKCPWNMPEMCANQDCDGDHCCAKDCADHGGPRKCGNFQELTAREAKAGAPGCRLTLQLPLVVVLALTAIFGYSL